MIKIISKKEYNEAINSIRRATQSAIEENQKYINTKIELERAKKDNTILKSKITRLENQIKKMQDEENKHKKLVKETLKEVHEEHKKRVGRPRKASK